MENGYSGAGSVPRSPARREASADWRNWLKEERFSSTMKRHIVYEGLCRSTGNIKRSAAPLWISRDSMKHRMKGLQTPRKPRTEEVEDTQTITGEGSKTPVITCEYYGVFFGPSCARVVFTRCPRKSPRSLLIPITQLPVFFSRPTLPSRSLVSRRRSSVTACWNVPADKVWHKKCCVTGEPGRLLAMTIPRVFK